MTRHPIWLKLTGCAFLAIGGLLIWQLPAWLNVDDPAWRLGIIGAGGAAIGSSVAALVAVLRGRRRHEDAPPPMSLIQQRIAIERQCVLGTIQVIIGGLGLVSGTILWLMDPSRWVGWLFIVVWLVFVISGVVRLARYRAARREFESEHGVGAGTQ